MWQMKPGLLYTVILGLILTAAVIAVLFARPARGEVPPDDKMPQDYSFAILRNGAEIGRHDIRFSRQGDALAVAIDISIDVSFGPIPIYRYSHHNDELWHDGRLVAITTVTQENGEHFSVDGAVTEEGFRIEGEEGAIVAAAGIIPTSYWNKAILERDTLLDSQRGTLMDITSVEPVRATEDGAACHALKGDLPLTLCYAGDRLVKLAFDFEGSHIEYQPIDLES